MMSVGADAGAKSCRFRILNTLNAFAHRLIFAPSPITLIFGRPKFFSSDRSTSEYPGPVRIFRQRQPGPLVVTSKLVAGFENTPLIHSDLLGLLIMPPKYA